MAWEENPRICLHMQLIAILSRTGVYTYIEKGKFALTDKPRPTIQEPTDAIVRVTLGSICSSDLHIKHGSVPRAVPGITVAHSHA